jgi:hypothetical protein
MLETRTKIQEIESTKKLEGSGYESRTKKGTQHSISHIGENRVLFTGRVVKTV